MLFSYSCKEKVSDGSSIKADYIEKVIETISTNDSTIHARFSPPKGFSRIKIEDQSFASYLRNFVLLDIDEQVHLYNGDLKSDQSVHASILDIDVGTRDLQQCADAVMRLRAEYLFGQKKYSDIAFDFTNGWKFEYDKWRVGNDLVVKGNKTNWRQGTSRKESYIDFRKYMNLVFTYAGTLSLSKELKPKRLEDIAIGDVFIVGGSPGHAVLVMDIAEKTATGDKAFMLAQSYMPAQQIHILNNKMRPAISPWYLLSDIDQKLFTPEWTFDKNELMGF